ENKGLSFQLEVPDDFPSFIESDELALKQILDNLLSNALKFTKKGHIKLKVSFEKTKLDKCDISIVVEDTGGGIPKEKLEGIFAAFSQVHEHGSVQERGSGLGLYISTKIINDLGGKIGVISEVGRGSVFNIELADISFFEEGETKDIAYTFFGDTILIADDYSINVKLYQAYLSKHNLKVETACDGKELVLKTKEMKPDLIVTDFDMPELNADQALRVLRDEKIETPVILVSALKIEEKIKRGFQGFLQKPVDEDVFLKEIARFIKHEARFIEEGPREDDLYEFIVPKKLSKKDLKTIQQMHEKFKYWRTSMEVTIMEDEIQTLKEQFAETKLAFFIPMLEKLEENTKKFNVNAIENILDDLIKKTKK
ncbi:MAG: ATP-binding protein, partial [Bdellovibrionota bacterium]|nr:ATP-binding protein [Bdellovibrionota bacterium]